MDHNFHLVHTQLICSDTEFGVCLSTWFSYSQDKYWHKVGTLSKVMTWIWEHKFQEYSKRSFLSYLPCGVVSLSVYDSNQTIQELVVAHHKMLGPMATSCKSVKTKHFLAHGTSHLQREEDSSIPLDDYKRQRAIKIANLWSHITAEAVHSNQGDNVEMDDVMVVNLSAFGEFIPAKVNIESTQLVVNLVCTLVSWDCVSKANWLLADHCSIFYIRVSAAESLPTSRLLQ